MGTQQVCPKHGLLDKDEVSIMNGVPFCTICNEDVEVIIDIKNCPIYGNVVRKSKKEIRDEINKALQGKKKM